VLTLPSAVAKPSATHSLFTNNQPSRNDILHGDCDENLPWVRLRHDPQTIA